jgi:hypothetical protein
VILVDSTVWIDLLCNASTLPVVRLRKLLDGGEAAVSPVIVQEVLQGAADASAFAKLQAYFAALPIFGAADPLGLHIAAGRLYARARWQGIMPRSANDCVVAAVAVEARIPLLHDDRDFEQLVAVETRLRLVPRH